MCGVVNNTKMQNATDPASSNEATSRNAVAPITFGLCGLFMDLLIRE